MSFDPTAQLPNTTVRLHEYVRADPNVTVPLPGMDKSCSREQQLFTSNACRIALTIPTSNRSSFIFELFLPDEDAWTGRFMATGNGGIDGCIKYEDIAYGLSHGFATAGTNNGHNGTGGKDFLDNPEIVIDYSWRALHTAADVSKSLIEQYYGKPPTKNYYLGCSGGGRQGIQAALLFPDDYDGIVVGAPALNFNYLSAWRAHFYTVTGSMNSTGFIAAETWQGSIHEEVLRQCDGLDGVQDGILADPRLCAAIFRPEALICGGSTPTKGNSSSCLTSEQVEVVRNVFSPLYGVNGEMIYPSLCPGAESRATERLLSGSPFPYSVDWYRYVVYSNPDWDPASWTIKDAQAAEDMNPADVRAWPSDLFPLRDRGSKLLIYHGGADQQITMFDTEKWYNYLSVGTNATSDELDSFVRFFRIPGMAHCSNGVGAWQIGQNLAGAKGLPYDSEHNVLAALVDWVEQDNAPEMIIGTKFDNDTVSRGVELLRPHCRLVTLISCSSMNVLTIAGILSL
jgi:feruloyl esterase